MFKLGAFSINETGNLTIGGCDSLDLAQEYGTPLYVIDENEIRSNCRQYKEALEDCYSSGGMIVYAGKAFLTKEMCRIINSEGLGLDTVSGGELYTAIKAEFPADKIYYHGNYKSETEIKMAIEYGIRCIVLDNEDDMYRVSEIATQFGKTVNVAIRLKPGINAHTHDFVMTGQIDSKFGVGIESGDAFDLVCKVIEKTNLNLIGIHCHIGSQIFDYGPFETTSMIMLKFIKKVIDEKNYVIKELNLGGGYGVRYVEGQNPVSFGTFIRAICVKVKEFCAENNMDVPFIIMEPGRSIVASAGATLYKTVCIKDIENVRKYAIVDGSMADSPRYILYGAEYDCLIASRPFVQKTEMVTIAGRTCESGDIIIKDIMMPKIETNDVLAVLKTGAYNYSMSSNYNRLPRPAVVLVNEGKAKVVVKAETYEDVLRNDL